MRLRPEAFPVLGLFPSTPADLFSRRPACLFIASRVVCLSIAPYQAALYEVSALWGSISGSGFVGLRPSASVCLRHAGRLRGRLQEGAGLYRFSVVHPLEPPELSSPGPGVHAAGALLSLMAIFTEI